MNMESIEVTLPTGFTVENRWFRRGRLRPLHGADEEAIKDVAQTRVPVERITLLLTRCLTELGPKTIVAANDVRALTVGDREALLLHLRRLMYGDRIQAILTCPYRECGEKMDLELSVGALLVSPNEQAKDVYEIVINENGKAYTVKFRLPTGADQEAVVPLARRDPAAASTRLLRRCVQEIRSHGAFINVEEELPDAVTEAISQKMAELDPQAETLLRLICPICEYEFWVNFDIGDYFFKEFMLHSQTLYREVSMLALHYHWSERDILEMTRSKRRMYLELLADTLHPEQNQ